MHEHLATTFQKVDTLERALDKGASEAVIEQRSSNALTGAPVHILLELAALLRVRRAGHPGLLGHMRKLGLDSVGLVNGKEHGSFVATIRSGQVWEVGPTGTQDAGGMGPLTACRAAFGRTVSSNLAGMMYAAFCEIIDNAAEHGRAEVRPVAAYTVGGDGLSFSVTDVGIGVLQTLRRNTKFAHIATGSHALEIALQDGNSGTGVPGRGNGFRQLFTALTSRRATLRFRSSTGAIALGATAPDRQNMLATSLPDRNGFVAQVWVPHLP